MHPKDRTANRLSHKHGDILWTRLQNLLLKLLGQSVNLLLTCFFGRIEATFKTGINKSDIMRHPIPVERPSGTMSGYTQRAEGITMIALLARNDNSRHPEA